MVYSWFSEGFSKALNDIRNRTTQASSPEARQFGAGTPLSLPTLRLPLPLSLPR
jgi:hypothetical protein